MTRAGWLGVQLATASEPPARQRRIWGVAFWRRHQPSLSCDLLLNHAKVLALGHLRKGSSLRPIASLEVFGDPGHIGAMSAMWEPGVIMAARGTKHHDRFNSEPFGVSTEMAIDQVFFGGPSVS